MSFETCKRVNRIIFRLRIRTTIWRNGAIHGLVKGALRSGSFNRGNSIEPKKTGKSGVNNRIYQSFYSISEEGIYKQNEFVNRSFSSSTV